MSDRRQSLARQTLVLAPGAYRLSLDARLDGLRGSGMVWTLSCLGDRGAALAELPVPVSEDWTPLSTLVTVPGDCEVQRLELRAGEKGGASAWGWFDDVRIEPVGAEA